MIMSERVLPLLPSKEQIQQLPLFQNLALPQIQVIHSLEQCQAIASELKRCALLGFDTESKPTFNKGEVSTGPHLIQLASIEKAYLFQMTPAILEFLQPILENPAQLKVGFGLKNDGHLFRKKGIQLQGMVELSKCFTSFGLNNAVGIKNAMAILFQRNFPKSKKISTSNWARKTLTTAQIQYATADAYAALLVFIELQRLALLPPHLYTRSLTFAMPFNTINAKTEA